MFNIFGKEVYDSVIKWGIDHYKKEYEAKMPLDSKEKFWQVSEEFYKKMNQEEKKVFYDILELTMIDTVSHVLGILDGSSSLTGGTFFETEIKIDGEDMVCELQDSFLAYVEEQNKWKKVLFSGR